MKKTRKLKIQPKTVSRTFKYVVVPEILLKGKWLEEAGFKPGQHVQIEQKKNKLTKTTLHVNTSKQGEFIEAKVRRILNNKEPIKDGAPLIYQERKEGIRARTNIRTDRFEVAVEASDKIAKSYKARREERAKSAETRKEEKTASVAEPTAGKGQEPSQ